MTLALYADFTSPECYPAAASTRPRGSVRLCPSSPRVSGVRGVRRRGWAPRLYLLLVGLMLASIPVGVLLARAAT